MLHPSVTYLSAEYWNEYNALRELASFYLKLKTDLSDCKIGFQGFTLCTCEKMHRK